MGQPRIEPTLDNQIRFVEYMLESNNIELLKAILDSLNELKSIKEKEINE